MAGTLTITTLSDGTNSTSATNPILGSAKAWVNFDGTGTVAIRGSYNVSSITDNGTGLYTINLTNAMTDTNYAVCTAGQDQVSSSDRALQGPAARAATTSTIVIATGSDTSTPSDWSNIYAAVFGN